MGLRVRRKSIGVGKVKFGMMVKDSSDARKLDNECARCGLVHSVEYIVAEDGVEPVTVDVT